MTDVVVVGGGLAGITAALRLADAGCSVTLHEARPKLGGLTHSFRRAGLDIDNGQHVFLRCCTSYLALLERLGVTSLTHLQPRLDVPVVRADDGRRAALRRDPLPAPLHLSRALATYAVLSPAERVRAVRGALAMRRVDRDAAETDEVSFGAWLADHGQTSATVAALWDLVGVATLNATADDASLAVAATVFQIGLLTRSDAADIGWSAVPLQQLHGDAAMRALDAAGVNIRVRSRIDSLEQVSAGSIVVATDPAHAERLVPPDALAVEAGWSDRLGASPIVNVHLVFDRTVMTEPFVAGVGTAAQWVFDRTEQSGLTEGQYVAVSVSAAAGFVDRTVAELRELFVTELARVLPATRGARLLDFFVTREPKATFRPAPGTRRDRPGTLTSRPGLVLAGAYTATGWPATMESAVRSGESAAAAVLGARHHVPEAVPA
jgi:hydroxysqualene dehydroxylase